MQSSQVSRKTMDIHELSQSVPPKARLKPLIQEQKGLRHLALKADPIWRAVGSNIKRYNSLGRNFRRSRYLNGQLYRWKIAV